MDIAIVRAHLTGKMLNMAGFNTTRLSSKGQIVIPEQVRESLGLKEGDQFLVIGQGDAVILKVITPPRMGQFEALLAQARAEARRAGITRSDLRNAVAKTRRRRK